jgi:hypothetical protein
MGGQALEDIVAVPKVHVGRVREGTVAVAAAVEPGARPVEDANDVS